MAPAASPRQNLGVHHGPRRGTCGQSSQLTQPSRTRASGRRAPAAVPGACPLAPAPLLASPAAARFRGRWAGPPPPLPPAAALSGGAHRWAPPTEVSVLWAPEEAEYGSRQQSRRARHRARPDSARCARPLSCALMRGRGRSARMRAARLPSPERPGAPEPFAFGLGGKRSGWPAAGGCRLEPARGKLMQSRPC